MKRLQPQQNAAGQLTRGSKAAVSEMSHSMMDLSVHNKDDDRGVPVPRFKAGVSVWICRFTQWWEKYSDILLK